jgi:hypothetical protein
MIVNTAMFTKLFAMKTKILSEGLMWCKKSSTQQCQSILMTFKKTTYHFPLLDFVSLLLVEVLVITGSVAPVGTPIEIITGPFTSGFVRIVSSSSIFLVIL